MLRQPGPGPHGARSQFYPTQEANAAGAYKQVVLALQPDFPEASNQLKRIGALPANP